MDWSLYQAHAVVAAGAWFGTVVWLLLAEAVAVFSFFQERKYTWK
jgi:hypothetical protein